MRVVSAISKLQHQMQGVATSTKQTVVSMLQMDYSTAEVVQAMLEFYEIAEDEEEGEAFVTADGFTLGNLVGQTNVQIQFDAARKCTQCIPK